MGHSTQLVSLFFFIHSTEYKFLKSVASKTFIINLQPGVLVGLLSNTTADVRSLMSESPDFIPSKTIHPYRSLSCLCSSPSV